MYRVVFECICVEKFYLHFTSSVDLDAFVSDGFSLLEI